MIFKGMKHRKTRIIGLLIYGFLIYGLGFMLQPIYLEQGYFVSLLISPFCIGAMAQTVFDPSVKNKWYISWMQAILLTVFVAFTLGFMGVETAVCLIIGAPLVFPLLLIGIFGARHFLGTKNGETTLKASAVLLPLLALVAEPYIAYPERWEVVRSEITLDAPIAEVWAQTVEISEIQPEERIWTFSHMVLGAPQPISAEVDGNLRDLLWTKGVRFQEAITERVENQRLAWRFSFNNPESLQAFDPHISPASDMLWVATGFYELSALPDGRTHLVLETHYRLRSPFNSYFSLWGELFLNDFQSSVLAVIEARVEA